MSAPEVLTVADVMERYRLNDRRAARRLMDEAGSFRMGARLFVRAEDLVALEDRQKAARRPGATPPASPSPVSRQSRTVAVGPGWWREASGAGTLAPTNPKERPA